MAYLLLIAEPVQFRAEFPVSDRRRAYERMREFAAELKERGVLTASESLTTDRVRVQKRDGRTSLVDGPFAEAKEVIGGFFLLNCATRDEAIEIARACPVIEWCEVEVRKVGPCWD